MNQIASKNEVIGAAVRVEINEAITIALVDVPVVVEVGHNHGGATVERPQTRKGFGKMSSHHDCLVELGIGRVGEMVQGRKYPAACLEGWHGVDGRQLTAKRQPPPRRAELGWLKKATILRAEGGRLHAVLGRIYSVYCQS